MAEISQSTLKYASDQERVFFADRVLSFIDPKFEDSAHMEASKSELLDFASKCELTCNEFIYALELAADGKLIIENDKGEFSRVKMFREVDRLKLGEIKSAYLFYKRQDKAYEVGKEAIKAYINPPMKVELTEEEKAQMRRNTFVTEYKRLVNDEPIMNVFTFYDLIVDHQSIETVKIKFVERVLLKYTPPTDTKNVFAKFNTLRNENPLNHFKAELVNAFIRKENLKSLSQEDWVEYWTNMYNEIIEKRNEQ